MENIIIGGLKMSDGMYSECDYPDNVPGYHIVIADINTGTVGNIGAGEDDLMTYTLPAGVMRNDGDVFNFKAFGTLGANVNNKQIRVKFGSTLLYDSGAQPQNNGTWLIEGTIMRVNSTSEKFITKLDTDTALFTDEVKYTTGAEDLTTALTLKITGEGVANNDIVQEGFIISYGNNE